MHERAISSIKLKKVILSIWNGEVISELYKINEIIATFFSGELIRPNMKTFIRV